MATINYYLRDTKAKNKTSIMLHLSMGKKTVLATGKSIPPKYWRSAKQEVHGSYTGGVEINKHLNTLKDDCLKAYERMLESNPNVSYSEIEASIREIVSGKKPTSAPDFLTAYDQFLKEKEQQVKPLTLKKYLTLRKLLTEFAEAKSYRLAFERINDSFDIAFRNFLSQDLGQVNDTISKYYDCLKVFLTWAVKNELYSGQGHKDFEAPRSKKDIIFLTVDELMKLYNLEGLSDRLAKVRDAFCFQCFTGQRFSDICELKWSDIKETVDGPEWHLYQIKGNKPKKVVVPLFPPAIQILDRNKSPNTGPSSKVLPTISNPKTNEYIKELCKLAGIDETTTTVQYSGKKRIERVEPKYNFISTHTARRTFVTLSLEKDMNPEAIMGITGHEDHRTLRGYMKITEKFKREQMSKAWGQF